MFLVRGVLHVNPFPRYILTTSELNTWQRRCDRLTQLQRRIKFPPLTSITVGNSMFRLPLAAVGPPSDFPTQEEMEYLTGLFDGDGCVSMTRGTGQLRLQLSQTLDSAKVLMRFCDRLGGGIYNEKCKTGARKAVLQWTASGKTMQHAANVLCSIPSAQGPRLEIAAKGNVAKADRSQVAHVLNLLKQQGHQPGNFQCSWTYFSVFLMQRDQFRLLGLRAHYAWTLTRRYPLCWRSFISSCAKMI